MLGKRILPSCVIIFRREFSSGIKANFCDRFFEHNLTSFFRYRLGCIRLDDMAEFYA